jgi:hypothetical protein
MTYHVAAGTGYIAYFLSSAMISPTIAFGIVACNPMLALLIDILSAPTSPL